MQHQVTSYFFANSDVAKVAQGSAHSNITFLKKVLKTA